MRGIGAERAAERVRGGDGTPSAHVEAVAEEEGGVGPRGAGTGESLRREAAGGEAARGPALSTNDTVRMMPCACVATPAESMRRADRPITPTQPTRAPCSTHCSYAQHPPTAAVGRAPAGRGSGELRRRWRWRPNLMIPWPAGRTGRTVRVGAIGELWRGPGCPCGACSTSGGTGSPTRFGSHWRRQRAAVSPTRGKSSRDPFVPMARVTDAPIEPAPATVRRGGDTPYSGHRPISWLQGTQEGKNAKNPSNLPLTTLAEMRTEARFCSRNHLD